MLGAADSIRRDARHAATPRLCYAVMTVDEVVSAGSNLRKNHGARQVRVENCQLIQPQAGAGIGNVVKRDELRAESSRAIDVGQKPRDVELEDPIGKDLIVIEGLAWTKAPV